MNCLTQQSKDIVQLSLHMDKQVQEKLIQWQEKKKYSIVKFIKQIKDKVLFLEQFNSYGRR